MMKPLGLSKNAEFFIKQQRHIAKEQTVTKAILVLYSAN